MERGTKILVCIIICLLIVAIVFFRYAFFKLYGSSMNGEFKDDLKEKTITPIEDINCANIEYTDEEESGVYSDYTARIDLNNMQSNGNGVNISGTTIKISNAGIYYFSGTSEDANIMVEADKDSDVVLVFDNCNITSKKTAVINGVKAKSIVVNLASGSENTFTDSNNYVEFSDEDEPDGTVFSKTDLIINGNGKLIINSNYKDGIVSKDGLKIVNTNIQVTSNDDGIRGKDYVGIKNSNITVTANGDGIKSTNTDADLGYIMIESGNINIKSGSDAIDAETEIIINSGNIDVTKSYEGIESSYIIINNGDISIIASDDGINTGGELVINGGNISVKSDGDGLDSNGSISITGGKIIVAGAVNGGNGALDYDNECIITGGTLIFYGAEGMWQNPSTNSTQYTIAFSAVGKSGDFIELKDSNGNVIESFTAEMNYGKVGISSSSLKQGETYYLYVNGISKGSRDVP